MIESVTTQEELSPHAQEQMRLEQEMDQGLVDFVNILKTLNLKNPPSVEILKNWKSKYGNIYMSNVTNPEEVFIWRTISRLEWRKMLHEVNMNDAGLREDHIINSCLLYPAVQDVNYEYGAGYSKSISAAIMYQSGFVDENYVISTIRVIE